MSLVQPGSLWIPLAPLGSLCLSQALSGSLSGSFWLALRLSLDHSGSLWLAVQLSLACCPALSGSLWLSQALWLSLALSDLLSGSL